MILFKDIKIKECYIWRSEIPFGISDSSEFKNKMGTINMNDEFMVLDKKFLLIQKEPVYAMKIIILGQEMLGWIGKISREENIVSFLIVPARFNPYPQQSAPNHT